MSAANRRRGADAERAVVRWLRDNGYPDARRYLAGDGRQPGDIDAIPGLCIEVKDCAQQRWHAWVAQAEAEADGRAWIVVRRVRGLPNVGAWDTAWKVDGTNGATRFDSFLTFWQQQEAA